MCGKGYHHVYWLDVRATWPICYPYKAWPDVINHIKVWSGLKTRVDRIRIGRWYSCNYAKFIIRRECRSKGNATAPSVVNAVPNKER